jgi:hypothetical protein
MGRESPIDPRIDLLLRLLAEGFDHKAWHGPNLRGTLRGLSAADAARRPAPDRHNIWEVAVHAAYWKYAVRRRVTGDARGSFPLKGSNWFTRPDPAVHPDDWPEAWAADLKLLDEQHRLLWAVVAGFDPEKLDRPWAGSKYVPSKQILGAAMHDVYHAGQIRMLKRAAASETPAPARKLKRKE